MDDRTDIIGALLSEAAGLLEEAASLAPLGDRTELAQRVHRIEAYANDALKVLMCNGVMSENGVTCGIRAVSPKCHFVPPPSCSVSAATHL